MLTGWRMSHTSTRHPHRGRSVILQPQTAWMTVAQAPQAFRSRLRQERSADSALGDMFASAPVMRGPPWDRLQMRGMSTSPERVSEGGLRKIHMTSSPPLETRLQPPSSDPISGWGHLEGPCIVLYSPVAVANSHSLATSVGTKRGASPGPFVISGKSTLGITHSHAKVALVIPLVANGLPQMNMLPITSRRPDRRHLSVLNARRRSRTAGIWDATRRKLTTPRCRTTRTGRRPRCAALVRMHGHLGFHEPSHILPLQC